MTALTVLTASPEMLPLQILDKKELAEAQAEEEVMNEIAMMARIQHPNVVNLKEVQTSRQKVYLIMENVSGGTVFDEVVKKAPYPVRLVWIMLPSCLGWTAQ